MMSEGMSPADLAAVTGNNNNDGFGNGWWIILLFLVWGRGFGGYGYGDGSQGAANNYVLASDFATLQRQLSDGFGAVERKGDSISNGLCDGFYAQNTTMLNGFSGLQQAVSNQGYESRLATQTLQSAMQNCCCDLRAGLADNKYALATQASAIGNQIQTGFCQTNFNAQTNTRDIVDSQRDGFQAVIARIDAMEANAKDAKIAEQAQQINALQLAASQAAQNSYLINQLRPAPMPAFQVPAPYPYGGCGCNCS